jgi:hypothetical protein
MQFGQSVGDFVVIPVDLAYPEHRRGFQYATGSCQPERTMLIPVLGINESLGQVT